MQDCNTAIQDLFFQNNKKKYFGGCQARWFTPIIPATQEMGIKSSSGKKLVRPPPSQQKSQYGGMSKTLSKKITGAKNS
jgi:hypothetical protein